MNDFVSWCMHLLVSFFHDVTSLHPPSFHRNDFSTCSTHFLIFWEEEEDTEIVKSRRSGFTRAKTGGRYEWTKLIRASVDALCRDGTGEI